jgi:hypothetical protein
MILLLALGVLLFMSIVVVVTTRYNSYIDSNYIAQYIPHTTSLVWKAPPPNCLKNGYWHSWLPRRGYAICLNCGKYGGVTVGGRPRSKK